MLLNNIKSASLLLITCSCFLFATGEANENPLINFLLKNVSQSGMPKSFNIPEGYWETVNSDPDKTEDIYERILATHGQNIYDAATWQIALAMVGQIDTASTQTTRLLSGKSGEIANIRAFSKDFSYGDDELPMPEKNAFFFRMISDEFILRDPLTGNDVFWMDWKPILGENAWAAMIGPLQVAYAKYNGNIPLDSDEVKLALSILPAITAMQSPIGAIYHSPSGVSGKNPHDISAENNASLLAGMEMLKQVLLNGGDPRGIVRSKVDPLIDNIERYFREYAINRQEMILGQGGLYDDPSAPGQFLPSNDFAVDVQTWGMTVIGPKKIDDWFGDGSAYEIWKNTKARGGYFENGTLMGVGYTDDPNAIISVEWTLGAILLVKELYKYYQFPDLLEDARTMRAGIEALKTNITIDGTETTAYHYASKRYNIPFGWWANKFPSLTSTAWVLMIDRDFNPFILGGQ